MTAKNSKNAPSKSAAPRDGIALLRDMFVDGKPEMEALLSEERDNRLIARRIHAMRTEAGMTQSKLAELIGTRNTVISRLENADYRGHSLSMLRRIATALGYGVELRFVPLRKRRPATTASARRPTRSATRAK